ncbi:unnamed protein product [Vicia faba]|uniref:Uncharacterized protein n=1 Tax=Vicia faba TaxID=3906 RepID=A0AAV0ZI07_VICFA|nr:unnamed protein product [Vicia faba]
MNFRFLGDLPWVKPQINPDLATHSVQTKAFASQAKQESSGVDLKLLGWPLSFLSFFPWANNAGEKFQRPTTINKELKRHAQNRENVVGKDMDITVDQTGYDTHDQAKLLKADLAFLECLENRHILRTKGDPNIAHLYKTMCINGLKNFLIPYRTNLVSLQQSGQSLIQFGWLSNLRRRNWNFQKT